MIKFIVLSTQRSGSSFLGTLLNSHPQIRCCEELFMRKNNNPITYKSFRTASLARRVNHVVSQKSSIYTYLDQLIEAELAKSAFGFSLLYDQVSRYPSLLQWSVEHDVRVLHLIRENTLKLMVSRKIAKKRGIYLSTKTVEPMKVRLNPHSVKAQLARLERLVVVNRKLFAREYYMEVTYEDYMKDQQAELAKIQKFLDVDRREDLRSPLVKISSDSLRDLVVNYNAIDAALRDSPYERYLS